MFTNDLRIAITSFYLKIFSSSSLNLVILGPPFVFTHTCELAKCSVQRENPGLVTGQPFSLLGSAINSQGILNKFLNLSGSQFPNQ